MRQVVGVTMVLSLCLASPALAGLKCGAGPTDVGTVSAVEAVIAAQCDCCAPPRVYAACVASMVRTSVRAKQLSGSCAMKVRRDVGHACPRVGAATTPCQVCSSDADCGAGAFCECRAGSCTKANGVCVAIPPVCPDVVAPVCGCDGTTYGNDCLRRQGGACKLHDGSCVAVGGCFDTIAGQCTGEACSPAAGCPLPNTFCSPTCATPPPTGTCFDTLARKCTTATCGPEQPCLPNQFCVTLCPPPPPSGRCFVTVDGQCSQELCGPGVRCQNPNEFCDPRCGAPAPCGMNADGTCGGLCPGADEVCTSTGTTCACMPTTSPACGDTFPLCNGTCPVGSVCTSLTGAPSCQCVPAVCSIDLDCDDGNACTADQCVNGMCEHACICVEATSGGSCCGPGPTCVPPTCGAVAGGTCGGACPFRATCEAVPTASAVNGCACVSSEGGPCGAVPPPACAPGLVCQQASLDATGVCVVPGCVPLFTSGCTQTSDCCEPCSRLGRAPCGACLQGFCSGAP